MNRSRLHRLRGWEWLACGALLLAFNAQVVIGSRYKSAGFDEEYHLAAGYAYLRTGDARLDAKGPPVLVQALNALPLFLLSDVNLPLDHPAWADGNLPIFARAFLWEANSNPQRLLALARLPSAALGIVLLSALFVWARQFYGRTAGWLALTLGAFEPNLIANARMSTIDLGLTAFVLLAMWRLWSWLERPSARNLVLFGLAMGMTITAKFSGLLIWPVAAVAIVLYPGGHLPRRLWGLAMAGFLSFAFVWALYRFDVGQIPGTNIVAPAPSYFYDLGSQYAMLQDDPIPSYMLGQISPRGWWYYYLVVAAVKTPLPVLILTAVGVVKAIRNHTWRRASVLWLPIAAFLGVTFTATVSLGYRHILAIVPFLILMACQSLQYSPPDKSFPRQTFRVSKTLKVSTFLLPALAGWSVLGTAAIFPHDEAFFNELAGGPVGGSQVLVDSNVDWGQDLPSLRRIMDERGIDRVHLGYFGAASPEAYGVRYVPLPGFLRFLAGPEVEAYNPYTPEPGWYAISVTSLRLGLLRRNVDMYAYFRDKQPVARAGYSINLYEVRYPDDTPVDRRVITAQRAADLPPEQLGVAPGHRLVVKWAESPETVIYPLGIGFRQPSSELFQRVAADFGGAFSLIGYELESTELKAGDSVGLTLYWKVGSQQIENPAPASRPPLATFVHLWDGEAQRTVSQYDGWGTALSGLEPGDVIAQHVSVPVPAGTLAGHYLITVGLYSPQTLERLTARIADRATDRLDLGTISIR